MGEAYLSKILKSKSPSAGSWENHVRPTANEKLPWISPPMMNRIPDDITTNQLVDGSNIVQLNDLGISFMNRFERTGDLDDISQAIKNQKQAVQLTPEGHPDKPALYNNLGISLLRRFQRSGDLHDISEAIKHQQNALQLTPDGHDNKAAYLQNLGNSFTSRFQYRGNVNDISEAIKIQQHALKLTPDGHAKIPDWLNNLGISFFHRFERSGASDDISEAIKNLQRAVQLTPDGHANKPSRLTNLGNVFSARFDCTGDLDDITRAIENQQQAIQYTPNGDADLPGYMVNLGISYSSRFQRTGDLHDISEAIKYQQHAIELTPDGHARLSSRLDGLGSSYGYRFQRTGDLDDISEAIRHLQRSVQLIPAGNANLPARLNNLGGSFSIRFERTGDLDDISEAIKLQRRAVQLTPSGDASMSGHLSNLGTSFFRRFERTADLDDICEAIKHHQHAIQLTPDGHANLPGYLQNLGGSFSRRFRHTRDLNDISQAIQHHQHAIQLTPDGHVDMPFRLNNLGQSYSSRFEITGSLDDISQAIKNQQSAVGLIPDGHGSRPALLNNLGNSFFSHYESSGNLDFLAEAVSSYRNSATSATGPPSVRLLAATQWATLSQKSPLLSFQLLSALACGIHLLSLVPGFEDTIQRRHQTLVNYSQLSIAAAATALSLGRSDLALEWLTEGRCIVWNQINQLRTPVDELRVHDQSLADRFSAVSRDLEIAGSRVVSESKRDSELSADQRITLEEQAGKHIKLAKERDQLLVVIRNVPGFEGFLLPKECADVMSGLPDEGVVVIINIHNVRCDALALMAGAGEPIHIPLSNFSYQEAERLAKGFRDYLLRQGLLLRKGIPLDDHSVPPPPHPRVGLLEVLSVLWSRVVWPILEALAFSVPDTESRAKMPRIWWCPTGPLAFLPIHAAGIYVRGEGMPSNQCLSEFAVSSYIPTVTTLKESKVGQPGAAPPGLLIVSQPNTPKQTPISGAMREATNIGTQLEKRGIPSRTLVDQSGTVESVLTAMESFPSIHLACHASQNATNPLKSSIYLHDGPLELSEIMKKNLPDSNLAFLSACQTSTGDKKLPEEVVHIAGGMLAAGYRSVVGTMWSIDDRHGPAIAESFYESLLDDATTEGPKMDGARAARALHHAMQCFREKHPDSTSDLLDVWVPYIHIGV